MVWYLTSGWRLSASYFTDMKQGISLSANSYHHSEQSLGHHALSCHEGLYSSNRKPKEILLEFAFTKYSIIAACDRYNVPFKNTFFFFKKKYL